MKPGEKRRPRTTTGPTRQGALLGVLAVCAAGMAAAAFWPALSAQAYSFDDMQYFRENRLVRHPSWESAKVALCEVLEPSTVRGYYQPLTMISLMLDVALGARPGELYVLHRTALLLHAVNTALVAVLLYRLFGRAWPAALVALLFGVHPMWTESVPWLAERKTLLATLFSLCSLLLYVRYASRRGWKSYSGCLVLYALALMSKPTGVPLPALMLLLDFWPLRRLSVRSVVEKAPFLLVGVASAVITVISQGRSGEVTMPDEYSRWWIPLTLCHNVVFYPRMFLWPAGVTWFYPSPDPMALSSIAVLTGVVGTGLLVVGLAISLRWTRALATGWLFFFTAVFPSMGVIGFTFSIAANRFLYLPCLGFLMIAAWGLTRAWGGGSVMRRAVLAMVVLGVAAAEATATRRYLTYWSDTETLYRYMLRRAPSSYWLSNGLADALAERGRSDEAVEWYQKALKLWPDYPHAHNNLSAEMIARGRLDEAIEHASVAARLMPRMAKAHYNLGTALLMKGRVEDAIGPLRESLKRNRYSADAHSNLGVCLFKQGKLDEAIQEYQEALRIDPAHANAQDNLKIALADRGAERR